MFERATVLMDHTFFLYQKSATFSSLFVNLIYEACV